MIFTDEQRRRAIDRTRGGTQQGNNLYAARVMCNRRKCEAHNRTARAYHGQTRAPWENAAATAGFGGLVAALAGASVPPIALAPGVLGHARRVR